MKTVENVLDFCEEFTFYDQHNFERVIKLNHVREFMFNLLIGSDFKHEENLVTMTVNIDDISLKILDAHGKHIEYRIIFLRTAILQMLCLEKIYNEKKDNENTPNLIMDKKERIRDDQVESS